MENTFSATLKLPFDEAIEKVRTTLAHYGFGIITEIDVKATLKKKLDTDFKNYVILGACNPKLAYRAIQTNDNVGLFLPCNVIVYEQGDEIQISSLKPTHALNPLGDKVICEVAAEAEKILDNVFNDLTT